MPLFARISETQISHTVLSDENPLPDELIQVPEIVDNTSNYSYINGEWVYQPKIIIPTIKEIDTEVVQKIREQYDENEEYKMLRFGIINSTNNDFIIYNNYVEECRQWGQNEKQKYGLIE